MLFGQLIVSLSALLIGLLVKTANLKVLTTSVPSNTTTNFPPRRSTELIVSKIHEVTLVCIMAQRAELPVYFEVVKPALELAIERVKILYPHLKFTLVARKDFNPCLENFAGALAAEEFYLRKVNAFIGPACSLALDPVARMASYWNIPIFTAGGIGMEFSKKSTYSSLTRMAFSLDRVSHFFVKILREYDWHYISLIVDETETSNILLRNSLQIAFKEVEFGQEIFLDIQSFNRKNNRTVDYGKILQMSSRSARIFILITTGELVRNILLHAHDLRMGSGDYAFISVELVKNKGSGEDFSWYRQGDFRNKQAREMFESLMMVAVKVPTTAQFATFAHQVVKNSAEEFGEKFTVDDVMKNF